MKWILRNVVALPVLAVIAPLGVALFLVKLIAVGANELSNVIGRKIERLMR